jgi:agmatinase
MSSWDNAFTGKPGTGAVNAHSYGGAVSFFRTPFGRDLSGIDVAVMGVPLDIATTNRPGARLGPRAIRNASMSLAWERPWPWKTDPLQALKVVDYGDCENRQSGDLSSVGHIESWVREILDAGTATLLLGGDHFIAYPSLRAHCDKHGPMALIHFDAHTDTWPSSGDGVNHGTMFYQAAKEGIVLPEHSIQIGIRTTNDDTLGYDIVSAPDVHEQSAAATGLHHLRHRLPRPRVCPRHRHTGPRWPVVPRGTQHHSRTGGHPSGGHGRGGSRARLRPR